MEKPYAKKTPSSIDRYELHIDFPFPLFHNLGMRSG